MAGDATYRTLEFTETFLATYASRDFSDADRRAFRKALRLLDENEQHPSLRVHRLQGDRAGSWPASASDALRMTFERSSEGRKRMLTCSRHYGNRPPRPRRRPPSGVGTSNSYDGGTSC